MYQLLKPFLFLLQPETAHRFTIRLFRLILSLPFGKFFIKKAYGYEDKRLRKELFGLSFKNPVGLAAGFDKDAKYIETMAHLGFGFIEIGTVTPKPQDGNPQPRLFRLKADKALINRMGFNNEGVTATVERLKKSRPEGLIIGGNIGKNKVTPNENAEEDYVICFEALHPYVDYFVVNVSSPNTPGLRDLQDKEPLQKLLHRLQNLNRKQVQPKPILLKIAPDLTDEQLDDIVEIVQYTGIAGVIATNTTIGRDHLKTSSKTIKNIGNGGLSGAPVKARATAIIRYLSEKSKGAFPIIAVGGISCVFGGYLSEKFGVNKMAFNFLLLSCLCCLISPMMFYFSNQYLFIAFLIFWGMVVIADSPLFSTLVAKNAPQKDKGTALTIVNCIGFSITIISILILDNLKLITDSNTIFMILSIGPILGLTALKRKSGLLK